MGKVLFVCTGNFYRSRFCEAFFNYTLNNKKEAIGWTSFSRGLNVRAADEDSKEHGGEISKHTKKMLESMGIPDYYGHGDRTPLKEGDLINANIIIALHEGEHRPMLEENFPGWEDRVIYWTVGDLWHNWTPDEALGLSKGLVDMLIEFLEDNKYIGEIANISGFMKKNNFSNEAAKLDFVIKDLIEGFAY